MLGCCLAMVFVCATLKAGLPLWVDLSVAEVSLFLSDFFTLL